MQLGYSKGSRLRGVHILMLYLFLIVVGGEYRSFVEGFGLQGGEAHWNELFELLHLHPEILDSQASLVDWIREHRGTA